MKFSITALVILQLAVAVLCREKRCSCSECEGSLELGIVLDSSSSISRDDFNRAKSFIQDFVDAFVIGPHEVRVSLISYGRDVHVDDAFYLNTHTNEDGLLSAIKDLPHYHQQYTNTGDAIKFMRTKQMSAKQVREGIPRISLVITDGNSQDTEKTAKQSELARESGIIMFTVGVGSDISEEELNNIAGSTSRVNRADNFERLADITQRLAKETCTAARMFTEAHGKL